MKFEMGFGKDVFVGFSIAILGGCSGGVRTLPDLSSSQHRDLSSTGVESDLASGGSGDGGVVINEVNPNGSDPFTDPDWVELENLGSAPVDLSTYALRDSKAADLTAFPSGTIIGAGERLVIDCDDAPDGGATTYVHMPFKLSGTKGDEVHLTGPAGGDVDMTSWGANAVATGQSWSRLPDGTGEFALGSLTPGAVNMP